MGITEDQAVFVGDQLFTDIYGAKKAGIYQILVKPIHPKEEIQIVLKRKLEKIVLDSYTRKKKKVTVQLMDRLSKNGNSSTVERCV